MDVLFLVDSMGLEAYFDGKKGSVASRLSQPVRLVLDAVQVWTSHVVENQIYFYGALFG